MRFQLFALPMVTLFPLVLGASAGCSSSTTPGPVDIPGYSKSDPISLEDYCAARASREGAWCGYFDRCCEDGDPYARSYCDQSYLTAESCVAALQGFMADSGAIYVPEYAQASLDEVFNRIPEVPDVCNGSHLGESLQRATERAGKRQDSFRALFQGQRGEGEACEYTVSCKFGLTCQGTSGNYACKPRGVTCISNEDCREGYVCDGRYCSLPPANGTRCTDAGDCAFGSVCSTTQSCSDYSGNAGDPCITNTNCKPGTACSLNGTNSRCYTLKTAGQSCTNSGECDGRCKAGRCVGICGGTGIY